MCDNVTVTAYINNIGGIKSKTYNSIACKPSENNPMHLKLASDNQGNGTTVKMLVASLRQSTH